jgi:Domain of unknown function (DUF389)
MTRKKVPPSQINTAAAKSATNSLSSLGNPNLDSSYYTSDDEITPVVPVTRSTAGSRSDTNTGSAVPPSYKNRSAELRAQRAQTHVNIVDRRQVESSTKTSNRSKTAVGTRDIIKIFSVDDDTDFIEVSPDVLERVKMMHDRMAEGANFSFNYNTLLFVASILAGLGLVSNSSATIIASMLVSPLMGPVVGLAYGTTIHDWNLVAVSMRTELFSLLFCIFMGFIIGAITGPTELADSWPTPVSTAVYNNNFVSVCDTFRELRCTGVSPLTRVSPLACRKWNLVGRWKPSLSPCQ